MHGQARHTTMRSSTGPGTTGGLRPRGAITWIDRRRAVIVKTRPDGSIDVGRVMRDSPGDGQTYLARVVHEIGDQERVLVVGPWPERTELEREYVAVHQRPDHLVDVEPSGPLGEPDLDEPLLVERLRRLVGS